MPVGHWALNMKKRQGRQERDLFNNSPLSSLSPCLPWLMLMSYLAGERTKIVLRSFVLIVAL
ncbi:hypothetical protein FD724_01460 [Nostoc sp. C057]|nr:hypothetical protein FD724_01460 [Nostoc sp. C057]